MRSLLIFVGAAAGVLAAIFVGAALAYEFMLFAWVYDWNPDYSSIDRCLDRGGRWVYESRQCEGSRVRPPTADSPARSHAP